MSLGVGYEISTENNIEGLKSQKYAILAENGPKMTILDPFQCPQVHRFKVLTIQN